ncbi:hypothetical protein KBK19_14155 [Microvirga sp. STR05]|uniref:Uncharacterized protein n=1 Tax=Hymenobacter duratus TaxID=2771356 RepID=A0ABR8JH64_9BACT|nr:hypothetical protein [Hymenobacter duratus]MBD2716181.1 hypothetical protein [Hymenobacter duratus]MBR7951095.1 hypothetical protein [Microvirga sp. STR05]
MKLTVNEYNKTIAIPNYIKFNNLCIAYKKLLSDNGFPLTIDISRLTLIYKTALFEKLLSVDKGLKMKFDLLRTDASKIKMISDEIDLDGYDIIDELTDKINELQNLYSRLTIGNRWGNTLERYISLQVLVDSHDLNLNPVVESWLIDWKGKERVKEYFENLFTEVDKIRTVFSAFQGGICSTAGALNILAKFGYATGDGITEIDEHAILELVTSMQKYGKFDTFNK